MLQLGESENRILEELRKAGDKGCSNKDLLKMPGMFPSNLSKFLKRLQNPSEPLVDRDVNTRRYRILEAGRDFLSRRDEVVIISRNRKIDSAEVELNPPVDPYSAKTGTGPYVLPARVSDYSTIEEDTPLFLSLFSVLKPEPMAESKVVRGLAGDLELLFMMRFARLAKDYDIYRVQQMPQRERRAHLRKIAGPYQPRKKLREEVEKLEAEYMKHEFPAGPPDLSLDNILDFEAGFLVTISREAIRKDAQQIKKRLVLAVLNLGVPGIDMDQSMQAMGKAGIIPDEEVRQYFQAKGIMARYRFAEKLRKTYADRLRS